MGTRPAGSNTAPEGRQVPLLQQEILLLINQPWRREVGGPHIAAVGFVNRWKKLGFESRKRMRLLNRV